MIAVEVVARGRWRYFDEINRTVATCAARFLQFYEPVLVRLGIQTLTITVCHTRKAWLEWIHENVKHTYSKSDLKKIGGMVLDDYTVAINGSHWLDIERNTFHELAHLMQYDSETARELRSRYPYNGETISRWTGVLRQYPPEKLPEEWICERIADEMERAGE